MKTAFIAARPVWIAGRETEKNVTALFVAKIGRGEARIDLTASCIYRMFVNGRFVEYGPARGPHGYFRIDRVDLTPYCTEEENYLLPDGSALLLASGDCQRRCRCGKNCRGWRFSLSPNYPADTEGATLQLSAPLCGALDGGQGLL